MHFYGLSNSLTYHLADRFSVNPPKLIRCHLKLVFTRNARVLALWVVVSMSHAEKRRLDEAIKLS